MANFFYVATDLGATVRGVGVLKALGSGWLITEYHRLPQFEGLPWLGGVVLEKGIYLWDGPRPERLWPATHLSLEDDQEVDGVVSASSPIVAFRRDELDLARAAEWWANPTVTVCLPGGWAHSYETDSRILSTRHTERRDVRQVAYGLGLYWPAMELMAEAAAVLGGKQSLAEWEVMQGEASGDGAAQVAAAVQGWLK
jgi:hypothetical protein